MTYDKLIQLYFERSGALQWYWTLYVVIIGGLLAFSSLRQRGDIITVALISVLFSFFAYKNLGAIHDVTAQRHAVRDAIYNYHPTSMDPTPDSNYFHDRIGPTLDAPPYEGIRNFHIACDVLTVLAIWAMELRRHRKAPAQATT